MILAFFGPVHITVSGCWMPFRISRSNWPILSQRCITLEWGPLTLEVHR